MFSPPKTDTHTGSSEIRALNTGLFRGALKSGTPLLSTVLYLVFDVRAESSGDYSRRVVRFQHRPNFPPPSDVPPADSLDSYGVQRVHAG